MKNIAFGLVLILSGCASAVETRQGDAAQACDGILKVVEEGTVTLPAPQCPDARWLGHGGETGRDWLWCCSRKQYYAAQNCAVTWQVHDACGTDHPTPLVCGAPQDTPLSDCYAVDNGVTWCCSITT